jgi:hypothetical protein
MQLMRLTRVLRFCFAAASVAGLVASAQLANAQDKAAIQKKLESVYTITQPTADKTDIVTAGSILVLQKSGLLMTEATKSDVNQNKYQDGRITQNALGNTSRFLKRIPGVGAPANAPNTRTFVKGEKMWLTKIEVKDNAVVLELFTDQMGDFRYRALLTFFGKGPLPAPDQVAQTVGEVFTVQPADNAAPTGDQQAAPAATAAAPAPVPPPAPPADAAPAPIPPPPPPPDQPAAPPKTISLGQTVDDVVANFGQPTKKAKVGTKEIYYYPDLKVTFVNGKVSDVQ